MVRLNQSLRPIILPWTFSTIFNIVYTSLQVLENFKTSVFFLGSTLTTQVFLQDLHSQPTKYFFRLNTYNLSAFTGTTLTTPVLFKTQDSTPKTYQTIIAKVFLTSWLVASVSITLTNLKISTYLRTFTMI